MSQMAFIWPCLSEALVLSCSHMESPVYYVYYRCMCEHVLVFVLDDLSVFCLICPIIRLLTHCITNREYIL